MLRYQIPGRSGVPADDGPPRWRARWRRALIGLVVLIIVLGAVTARLFVFPARGMPRHVDAIVLLDGPGDRLATALRLGREHRASYLAISQGSPPSRDNTPCPRPIPGVRVICFHPRPATTRGEAQWAGRMAARYHWRSIAMITSTPQDTPARIRLGRCFGGHVYVTTAPIPARSWPHEVAYEWGATLNALLLDRGC